MAILKQKEQGVSVTEFCHEQGMISAQFYKCYSAMPLFNEFFIEVFTIIAHIDLPSIAKF